MKMEKKSFKYGFFMLNSIKLGIKMEMKSLKKITIDADGKKKIKRTKVKKDKDGNEIIEDEIIDEFGNR